MSDEPQPAPSFWNLFAEPKAAATAPSPFWKLFSDDSPPPEEPSLSAVRFDEQAVFWAMRDLPIKEAAKHFLICGATGSGKTIGIQLFLQSIAPRFQDGRLEPEQLILFDAKCDAVPFLAALDLRPEQDNVWILNPFDVRSAVWNLGEAVQTPVMARALATLLVPEEKNTTAPFFADASRELVHAVLQALTHVAGSTWTFRDLLCALDSQEHIAAVTARFRPAQRQSARILNDDKHSAAVLSTLATKLGRFEQVATLWNTNRSNRSFSLTEFLKRPGVLVLGNDPVLRDSFWPINAILLKALTQELLRRPDTAQPRCWFVLDEFRAMEKVECVHELLNRGRSKGVSVLLGLQSVEGLVDVYGENNANDILSQCAHKTFLRAGGPKTAEWAENFFSKVRRTETTVTETEGREVRSKSVQYALQERSLFLPSFFLDLPFPTSGGSYVAVCDVPCLRETLIVRRNFDEVLAWCRAAKDNKSPEPGDVPAVVPRLDVKNQTLWPWNKAEEKRFCGALPKTAAKGDAPVLAPLRRKS